jgi:predicted GNAT superfamily acetyltransferase
MFDANMAAARAGVEVRILEGLGELTAAAQIFTELWAEPTSVHLLRALRLSENYVAGAFDGTELVGACIAWGSPPPVVLHSHATAVRRHRRDAGIGRALKYHQRLWARQRGIAFIGWTFDPLVQRNARFNLRTLDATVTSYEENIYGIMGDPLNQSSESDRFTVLWDLESAREDTVVEQSQSSGLAIAIPEDIEVMRVRDPHLAATWRARIRTEIGGRLAEGWTVAGIDAQNRYVLWPPGRDGWK